MSHALPWDGARTSHWRASLIAVCFAQATAIVGFDFTLPFIPLYLQHDLGVRGLGQTALWAGLIGFGPAIPATIFGPIWGRVADRVGYRFMLLRAMICAAILLAMMGLAPSPLILLVLRMVQGALTGTVFASQALVAATVPESETGRSIGLLQMSISVGATLGPVGGGAVAQTLGYRAAFIAAGALIAIATIVVTLFVREPAHRVVERQEKRNRTSLISVLTIPAFAAALALTLASQLAVTMLFPIIPLYVQDLVHNTRVVATDTGWVMALSGLAAAGGSYSMGRIQRHVPFKPLLFTSIVISAALLAPQGLVPNYLSFLGLRAIASFAFGGLFGLVGIWAALSSPADSKGTAFGLMGAASSMGFGAGPLIGGALVAVIGIRPVFLVSALMLACIPIAASAGLVLAPVARKVPFRRTAYSTIRK